MNFEVKKFEQRLGKNGKITILMGVSSGDKNAIKEQMNKVVVGCVGNENYQQFSDEDGIIRVLISGLEESEYTNYIGK